MVCAPRRQAHPNYIVINEIYCRISNNVMHATHMMLAQMVQCKTLFSIHVQLTYSPWLGVFLL